MRSSVPSTRIDAGGVVSGYPNGPDQHLLLDPAERSRLRPVADKVLTLQHCLEPAQVDPSLYVGRSLYLLPDGPSARHTYVVLVQALDARRRWALGWGTLNGCRRPILVRPLGRLLVLHVLHYPAQVRPASPFESTVPDHAVTQQERDLAGQLIDAATPTSVPWADYRNDAAERLAALAEASARGETPRALPPQDAPVPQLLEALKRSIAAAQQQSPTPAPTAATRQRGNWRIPRRSS